MPQWVERIYQWHKNIERQYCGEKKLQKLDNLYGQPWTHEHMSRARGLNKLCVHEFGNMGHGGS